MFLSSSRVYASQESPIREDSMRLLDVSHDSIYLKTDEYALAKARQEDILRKSGKTTGQLYDLILRTVKVVCS